jgi:hypothetical protein
VLEVIGTEDDEVSAVVLVEELLVVIEPELVEAVLLDVLEVLETDEEVTEVVLESELLVAVVELELDGMLIDVLDVLDVVLVSELLDALVVLETDDEVADDMLVSELVVAVELAVVEIGTEDEDVSELVLVLVLLDDVALELV